MYRQIIITRARLDVFRRGASQISNEQVCISYEITESRMKSIKEEMKKDTEEFYKRNALNGMKPNKIYNVFLLDDFSGSGISYLRIEKDASGKNIWKGKIKKVIDQLEDIASNPAFEENRKEKHNKWALLSAASLM